MRPALIDMQQARAVCYKRNKLDQLLMVLNSCDGRRLWLPYRSQSIELFRPALVSAQTGQQNKLFDMRGFGLRTGQDNNCYSDAGLPASSRLFLNRIFGKQFSCGFFWIKRGVQSMA